MKVVTVIQARMGSSRLPGKVMLPLAGKHVLTHDVRRTSSSTVVDDVVVATSRKDSDDIVARYGSRSGATVHRGSETNVLSRVFEAADRVNADVVVRVTGDCPLVDPETLTDVTQPILSDGADYAANILERTFPRGLDVEAFTFESFERVHEEATDPHHREHVTPYYRENPDEFDVVNVTSDEVFDDPQFRDRSDLRLTLDEADDYEVLREVYENVDYDGILPVRDAIRYVDDHDLMSLNESVEQKEV